MLSFSTNNTRQNGTSSGIFSVMETTPVSAAEPTTFVVVLAKNSRRRLTVEARDKHLATIVATVNNKRNVTLGWRVERRAFNGRPMFKEVNLGGNDYRNEAPLNVWMEGREPSSLELAGILRNLNSADAVNSENKWHIATVNGEEYAGETRDADEEGSGKSDINDLVPYADCFIPENKDDFFQGLYGLEAHISRMLRAINLAISTDFEKRINTILVGPPACGKSELMRRLKRMVGKDAVLEIDATSTTAKGLQDIIAERSVMPRILLVEEIEKGSKELHEVLLSIMDTRGEIRKVTARGKIMMEARMVTVCTANDWEKFCDSAAGAISSRTSNPIHFERVKRDVMWKIVERELKDIGASTKIIDKVLDYAEEIGEWDTREIIALALCGGDDWLNGEYVKELRATAPKQHNV